jgi:hypothetical protein
MKTAALTGLRWKWIIGHGIAWAIALSVLKLNASLPLEYQALVIALPILVVYVAALWRVIGRFVSFYVIVFLGWYFGTLLGLGLGQQISQWNIHLGSWTGLLLMSIFWGGMTGITQMVAWSSRVQGAFLWLVSQWLLIFVLLVVYTVIESLYPASASPSLLWVAGSALVAGCVYGALSSFILLWQVRHPIFAYA